MASSLTLKRLVSGNLLSNSLRPVATSFASDRIFNTNHVSRRYDDDDHSPVTYRRSDSHLLSRRDLSSLPDAISPFSSRSLSQTMYTMYSPNASRISSNWDAMRIPNGASFSKKMSSMVINGGGPTSSKDEEKGRKFSTAAADLTEQSYQKKSLRPLSPHLPIYKPQLSSTTSILNRISGIILTSTILGSYFYLKVGSVALTYGSFYQFFFYSTNLVPLAVEISALALAYHTYAGIGHLVADFSGKLSTSKNH